jgi:hypothetical protein
MSFDFLNEPLDELEQAIVDEVKRSGKTLNELMTECREDINKIINNNLEIK